MADSLTFAKVVKVGTIINEFFRFKICILVLKLFKIQIEKDGR